MHRHNHGVDGGRCFATKNICKFVQRFIVAIEISLERFGIFGDNFAKFCVFIGIFHLDVFNAVSIRHQGIVIGVKNSSDFGVIFAQKFKLRNNRVRQFIFKFVDFRFDGFGKLFVVIISSLFVFLAKIVNLILICGNYVFGCNFYRTILVNIFGCSISAITNRISADPKFLAVQFFCCLFALFFNKVKTFLFK